MSAATNDDDDQFEQPPKQHLNGGAAVSDEDIRALLDQEREKTKRLEGERNRERSERSRAEAQVSSHQTARYDAEEQAVTARIATADSEATGLRRDYATALSEGNFEAAAEVNDKIAELRAKQNADRQYKTWLESEKTRASAAPQQQGVDLSQFSGKQRAWIRKHPEYMEDEQLRGRVFAAHHMAVADGHEVDSPEYFDAIEAFALRAKQKPKREAQEADDDGDGHEGSRHPPVRRERAVEVPVTRSQPGEGRRQDRPIKLSPGEREAADFTLAQYPEQGFTDNKGVYHPDRYTVFFNQREKLKQQGRL